MGLIDNSLQYVSLFSFQVHFCDFPQTLLQGEVRQVVLEFTNTGTVPLTGLKIASTDPALFTFGSSSGSTSQTTSAKGDFDHSNVYSTLSSDRDSEEFIVNQPEIKFIERIPLSKYNVNSSSDVLGVGETIAIPVWIHGPCFKDTVTTSGVVGLSRDYDMQMMFMYEGATSGQHKMRYVTFPDSRSLDFKENYKGPSLFHYYFHFLDMYLKQDFKNVIWYLQFQEKIIGYLSCTRNLLECTIMEIHTYSQISNTMYNIGHQLNVMS